MGSISKIIFKWNSYTYVMSPRAPSMDGAMWETSGNVRFEWEISNGIYYACGHAGPKTLS